MSKHHSFLHFPCHSCMVAPEYAIALWSKYNSNLATPGCEGEYLVTVACVLIGFWAENQFVWWVVNFPWTTQKKKKLINCYKYSWLKKHRDKTGMNYGTNLEPVIGEMHQACSKCCSPQRRCTHWGRDQMKQIMQQMGWWDRQEKNKWFLSTIWIHIICFFKIIAKNPQPRGRTMSVIKAIGPSNNL